MANVDYRVVLEVAVEAATRAGAILRSDFLKPGGPDGHGEHADADDRAEEIIRRLLLEATPTWSYRGEETGYHAGTEGRHTWLVDPNDGTSAYLQGYRGSAVSIGLLRDGVPVLGVVNAYAAPDNQGDLFAWAEGCGPLRRNGAEMHARNWATGLAGSIALVSHAADRAPLKNLRNIEPGRYRTVTSIAYRLALLAAGEGETGICLSGAGDWDHCGGHALLQAQGGMLLDEAGTPVTYTLDGRSHTEYCFGGAGNLVRDVAQRDWSEMEAATAPLGPEKYDLIGPKRGETIADDALFQRAQGAWFGQLTGDALGSMVEFRSAADLARAYPRGLREIGPSPVWNTLAGQPTDDSELALMLARTLLADGGYDERSVFAAYRLWYETGTFDVGGTIGAALRGNPNGASKANGALMRQSPLAIWGHALPAEVLAGYVRSDTRLTHPNATCVGASAAFVVALAATIHEGLDGIAAHERACRWASENNAEPEVAAALDAARHTPPDFATHSGFVLVALQNAFYQALHARTFEEGVMASVMGGGDTDTNAAICGALLGAVFGVNEVPAQWRDAVLTCRPQAGIEGVSRPGPRAFWPVDAPILAERLAIPRA